MDDNVKESNVMFALAVIVGVPETPVAAKVNESNVMLAFPRIKRDAVETSVKSSSVLDKELLINRLAVLDTVTGSNVMLALAVIGGVPETPVADNVKSSKVIEALPRIKRDAVETSAKESKVMFALPTMPLVAACTKGKRPSSACAPSNKRREAMAKPQQD